MVIPKESSIKIEGPNLFRPKGTKVLTINDKIFSSKLNGEFQLQPLEKKLIKKPQ